MGPLGLDPIRRWAQSESRDPIVINQMNVINVFILNHGIIYMLLLASMWMIC